MSIFVRNVVSTNVNQPQEPPSSSRTPYDPEYDPIIDAGPGYNCDPAPTYWIGTAGLPPEDDGAVVRDITTEVAVVGSGYTGLSTAIHLAEDHGMEVAVLEANTLSWGCSTRNGGQAQLSTGRLKHSQWIERWGLDTARAMHAEMLDAFERFEGLIARPEIECDPQPGGHFSIGHRPKAVPALERENEVLNSIFGYKSRIVSRSELHATYVREEEAAAALWAPHGTCVHASKLAFGYIELARRLGVKVHTASPVLGWEVVDGKYHIQTPGGTVRAKSIAIATAGYTPPALNKMTRHRLMPILSNSVVTRPLKSNELAACGIQTKAPLTDTRTLRHYYRLLPDNRMQIGSRSAVTGRDAENPRHLTRLLQGLWRKFPILKEIEVDFSWWGWVDVSHDMMPRIFQPDPEQRVYYAMGYGGNGVMYSAQAGRRMAQLIAGQPDKAFDLPIFSSPLPSHGVLTPFRRLGQRAAYIWYHLRDEAL